MNVQDAVSGWGDVGLYGSGVVVVDPRLLQRQKVKVVVGDDHVNQRGLSDSRMDVDAAKHDVATTASCWPRIRFDVSDEQK